MRISLLESAAQAWAPCAAPGSLVSMAIARNPQHNPFVFTTPKQLQHGNGHAIRQTCNQYAKPSNWPTSLGTLWGTWLFGLSRRIGESSSSSSSSSSSYGPPLAGCVGSYNHLGEEGELRPLLLYANTLGHCVPATQKIHMTFLLCAPLLPLRGALPDTMEFSLGCIGIVAILVLPLCGATPPPPNCYLVPPPPPRRYYCNSQTGPKAPSQIK